MPVVFQTGEREPRPLFPTDLVYTTAQNIADILQIPLQDPVYLSFDVDATHTACRIAATDQRLVGFSPGDEVEMASDTELGETLTIDTAENDGVTRNGSHVVINFTSAVVGDYDTADNATLQNLQSFTNGKRRGVTRRAVETMILRMQDKIDNLCNNAWRPMLQTAEYLNFDTYKPYRRRYYTDYVGTVPLMFRNIQQILRLEIWQGQEYREVGSSEARLKILDNSLLTTDDYMFLCPGSGGVASLRVGNGPGEWRNAFDVTTTAQELSDLINKDLRKGKADVPFLPSFTLQTANTASGSTIAYVHHEFMTTANADYGTGQIKLTSMHRGEGGENSTIALTNLNGMSITGLNDTVLTIPTDTGPVYSVSLTSGGTGYTDGQTYTTTGGSGTGYTLSVDVTAGAVTGPQATITAGTGYKVGDVLTLTGGSSGDDATVTVGILGSNISGSSGSAIITMSSTSALVPYGIICIGTGAAVKCAYYTAKTDTTLTGVTDLASSGLVAALSNGDSITQYALQIDYFGSTTGDEARLRDWWCDYDLGIIYFNNTYPYFQWNSVKATYVYGERYVEKAIEDICTKMVAMDLLLSDDRSVLMPEGTQNIDLGSKYQLFKAQVAETLPRYMEVMTID